MDPDLQRYCGLDDPVAWRRAWGLDEPLPIPIHPTLLESFALPLLARLRHRVEAGARPALAINGPVGAGKSSLAAVLAELAPRLGLRLGVASIDDFYLPWPERQRAMAGNPFGVSRVPPGSHDAGLLEQSLRRWRGGGPWERPRFDKRLRDGQGDRAGLERVNCEALVVEGWLMGCRPLGLEAGSELALEQARRAGLSAAEALWLPHWDHQLGAYQGAWAQFEELWLLRPTDWSLPRRWRFQAEARQRRAVTREQDGGGTGRWLDPPALEALVRSSLASLPPPLYQDPLVRQQVPVPTRMVATLDGRRRCVACRWLPGGEAQASPPSSSSLMG